MRDAPAPKPGPKRKPLVLEPAEGRRLIRSCLDAHDPRLLAIACLAELGIRAGQLRALRFEDLHGPFGPSLMIERTTRVRLGSRDVTEEGDTKSRASRRRVGLPAYLYGPLFDCSRERRAPSSATTPAPTCCSGNPSAAVTCPRARWRRPCIGVSSWPSSIGSSATRTRRLMLRTTPWRSPSVWPRPGRGRRSAPAATNRTGICGSTTCATRR